MIEKLCNGEIFIRSINFFYVIIKFYVVGFKN